MLSFCYHYNQHKGSNLELPITRKLSDCKTNTLVEGHVGKVSSLMKLFEGNAPIPRRLNWRFAESWQCDYKELYG